MEPCCEAFVSVQIKRAALLAKRRSGSRAGRAHDSRALAKCVFRPALKLFTPRSDRKQKDDAAWAFMRQRRPPQQHCLGGCCRAGATPFRAQVVGVQLDVHSLYSTRPLMFRAPCFCKLCLLRRSAGHIVSNRCQWLPCAAIRVPRAAGCCRMGPCTTACADPLRTRFAAWQSPLTQGCLLLLHD